MPIYRFDVLIPHTNGLPEDTCVNTWHFENPNPALPPSDFDNVRDMLRDFYQEDPGKGAGSISANMPSQTVGTSWQLKAYDLGDPKPRVPVYTSGWTASGLTASDPLPAEVALVLSIHAAPQSGISQARRRNRKYLGPFGESVNSNQGRPATVLVNTVAAQASELLQAAQASVSWGWRVFSTTNDASYTPIGGWVDDAWDTQRRRGVAATTRVLWDDSSP